MFGSKAAIQYMGERGVSRSCADATSRLIQYGDEIKKVRILSTRGGHAFLIWIHPRDCIAIKQGFSSGYDGEGPRTFSYILALLDLHCGDVEEVRVSGFLMRRLNNSALTKRDIRTISSTKRVPGQGWRDYVSLHHLQEGQSGELETKFPPVFPFSIIDPRIMDLARNFWHHRDNHLRTAYVRLEGILAKRAQIPDGYGSGLFSAAFIGPGAKLTWQGLSEREIKARVELFQATYATYRNKPAHREVKNHHNELLAQFLMVNNLFRLESEAVEK